MASMLQAWCRGSQLPGAMPRIRRLSCLNVLAATTGAYRHFSLSDETETRRGPRAGLVLLALPGSLPTNLGRRPDCGGKRASLVANQPGSLSIEGREHPCRPTFEFSDTRVKPTRATAWIRRHLSRLPQGFSLPPLNFIRGGSSLTTSGSSLWGLHPRQPKAVAWPSSGSAKPWIGWPIADCSISTWRGQPKPSRQRDPGRGS